MKTQDLALVTLGSALIVAFFLPRLAKPETALRQAYEAQKARGAGNNNDPGGTGGQTVLQAGVSINV